MTGNIAPRDHLHVDEQLCFALYNATRAVTRAYTPLLEPLGLTYPQYLVLLVLWERDGLPVKEVGHRLALDSGTLTPLLKRLEQQGLVDRRRDEADERIVRIHLTAEGRALRAKATSVPLDLACRAGYNLASERSVGELVHLRDELTALVQRLSAQAAAAKPPEA